MTKYDTEGRRVGSEVSQSHRAWCESCGWFGPTHTGHGSQQAAENNGVGHDITEHGAGE